MFRFNGLYAIQRRMTLEEEEKKPPKYSNQTESSYIHKDISMALIFEKVVSF